MHVTYTEHIIFANFISLFVKTVIEQNNFEHNLAFCKLSDGLTIGAPTSPTFSEVFVKYMKHTEHLNKQWDHCLPRVCK